MDRFHHLCKTSSFLAEKMTMYGCGVEAPVVLSRSGGTQDQSRFEDRELIMRALAIGRPIHRVHTQKPLFCDGILPLPEEMFPVYLRQSLNLFAATDDQIQCLKAEYVALSHSMSKGSGLDSSNPARALLTEFGMGFNPMTAGILKQVRETFLEGDNERADISSVCSKLGIYEKGHQAGYRSRPLVPNMFATLFVIFRHAGGVFAARRGGSPTTIDLEQRDPALPYVQWIAVPCDVDLVFGSIPSGYRVMAIYHILIEPRPDIPCRLTTDNDELMRLLVTLINDSTFLPKGGHLVFGLRHRYPFTDAFKRRMTYEEADDVFTRMCESLRGRDAALLHVCRALSLSSQLQAAIEDKECNVRMLCNVALLVEDFAGDPVRTTLWKHLRNKYAGLTIKDTVERPVKWITGFSRYPPAEAVYWDARGEPGVDKKVAVDFCITIGFDPFKGGRRTSEDELDESSNILRDRKNL
ncbi:hypothetical protein A0H81_10382 [Grifola frondosa]|uniref:Uncharacterized protein n=1 Tax=Grifola frondosa TaxID=5627 RepID=A0A1C7LYX2_GRIFR|nr:hypothetical protein A0H81_10382 [Grifola frondosa]